MNNDERTTPGADSRTREFVQLLGAHDGRLHAYILSLVPNWADAHEIAQDVRLRLWEQFDQYDPHGDFGAWARTIAYYQVLAFRKTSSRQHARLSSQFIEAIAQHPGHANDLGEARYEALMACLQAFSDSQRELLMRYYSGNQSIRQIAEATDRSFHGLRQRVLRLRKALAKCVTGRLTQEGSQ